MLELKVLVLKLVSVDRFASSAIVVGEVTTLTHEVWNHTMERAVLETESLLAGAKCAEVFLK